MSVMRKALLWASTNVFLREHAMRTAFVRRSVVKFMPGERVEDAIEAAKDLKPVGLTTILTRLGENLTRISEAGRGRRPLRQGARSRRKPPGSTRRSR